MSKDGLWFRQDSAELNADWLFFLSADARIAWLMLKDYVKGAAVSQKAPNKAPRLSVAVAAQKWNVQRCGIEHLEEAAVAAGALSIEDGQWIVADKLSFQSERTSQRYTLADIDGQAEHLATNGEQDADLSDKRRQTSPTLSRATETETETETDNSPLSPPKGSRVEIPAELDDPKFHEAWKAWLSHLRAKGGRCGTPEALRRHLVKLQSLGVAEAIRWLEYAIYRGWQAPFEPKDKGSPRASTGTLQDKARQTMEAIYGTQ